MYERIKELYDSFNTDILSSSFVINATLHIMAEEVAQESIYEGYGRVLDPRESAMFQKSYPLDLNRYYRVKVLPVEKFGLSANGLERVSTLEGRYAPYDMWISVFKADVQMANNKCLFDYTDTVEIDSTHYNIKGMFVESFGNKDVIHTFLTKKE